MVSPTAQGSNRFFQSLRSSLAQGGYSIQTSAQPLATQSQASLPSNTTAHTFIPNPKPQVRLTDTQKMDIFESVLDEIEQNQQAIVPQSQIADVVQGSTPVVNNQATPVISPASSDDAILGQLAVSLDPNQINTLNPPQGLRPSGSKESLNAIIRPDVVPSGGGVEFEKSSEISPELQTYMQEVRDNQNLAPEQVVIADGQVQLMPVQYAAQPVIVLPITPEIEEIGAKKSPQFSIRWLVEWSHKIIKMFAGKVVYQQAEN